MADIPPPLTLIIGDEELLVSRAVEAVIASAREADPDADVRIFLAAELDAAAVADLISPSLFGERRVLVLREAQDASKELVAALSRCLAHPEPDIHLVVAHPGGSRGRQLVDAMRGAGATVVDCPRPRGVRDRTDFLQVEFRRAGRTASPDGVAAVLAAVGSELRELANAAAQLAADTTGIIDADVVGRYYRGRAEASGFAVADKAVEGDAAGALELLRWALLGPPHTPLLVTGALAGNLRTIAKVAAASSSSPAALARSLALPPWKAERAVRWARTWRPEALAGAIRATAAADAEIKGGASDPRYAIERAVLAVAAAARGGPSRSY